MKVMVCANLGIGELPSFDLPAALCERQTVQVMGGQVVPDRLRFALTTRPDSGSSYDLIVHEDGRGPAELAARVPYKAQVAFANDLFDL